MPSAPEREDGTGSGLGPPPPDASASPPGGPSLSERSQQQNAVIEKGCELMPAPESSVGEWPEFLYERLNKLADAYQIEPDILPKT
jgi:hypothetical protein